MSQVQILSPRCLFRSHWLSAPPGGAPVGLVLQNYPRGRKLVADAVRLGPVLRAARPPLPAADRLPHRWLREPEPLCRGDTQKAQHTTERRELRCEYRRARLIAPCLSRI